MAGIGLGLNPRLAVDVVDALRAAYPDGVEAVLDLVNGRDAIRRGAQILKAGGNLVSTLYAAQQWFAKRKITAHILRLTRIPFHHRKG